MNRHFTVSQTLADTFLDISKHENIYTGATTISGGVLAVTGSGTVGTGNITVGTGASFDVSGTTAGSKTMASGKSLGGAGTVVGGLIMASGSILAPTSGSTLTVAALTFGSAGGDTGIINIASLGSYTTNAAVNVTGNLVLQGGAGAVTVNLASGAISSGTYRLIGTGSLTDTSGFTLGTTSFLTARQSGGLILNSGSLDYVVTGSNPYWTVKSGSEWSTATLASPKNWETAPGVTTDFLVNDSVIFNDSATSTTVNIATNVNPASVEFNNSATNYSVTGSAGIAGSSTLVKNGSGTVTLGANNTYSGTTQVNLGTLLVNGNSSAAMGAVTVASGATLGGTGTIGGAVNVTGTLAPGASIESLGTGALAFATGSTFAYELDSSTLNGDLPDSTGTLDIAPGAILTLTELAFGTLANNSKLTLISYTGGWVNTELFTYLGGTLNDGDIVSLGANQWQFDYNDIAGGSNYTPDQSGATRFVTITVVPEPSAALLGALGLLPLLRRRRA